MQQEEQLNEWQQTLSVIAANKNSAPLIGGYSTRLLSDYKVLTGDALTSAFGFALSRITEPSVAASWLEGFLKGSGTILLIDHDLWSLVNSWVNQLEEDIFIQLLPIMRRTFSQFANSERRKLGEKVKSGDDGSIISFQREENFDYERAKEGISVVMKLLGLENPE